MINHFRTTLMNISEANPPVITEYIHPGYTTQTLPTTLANFRALLFPSATRSDILARTAAYTILIIGCNLSDVFTLVDSRITYSLDDITSFGVIAYDLETLAKSVINDNAVNPMLALGSNYPKYLDNFQNGITDLQKLAGLISNYSYKLS